MELKFTGSLYNHQQGFSFQSYLYGIEIFEIDGSKRLFCSFNRTFMELKCSSIHDKRVTGASFQSYLYGIEMAEKNMSGKDVAVSIVPLWN